MVLLKRLYNQLEKQTMLLDRNEVHQARQVKLKASIAAVLAWVHSQCTAGFLLPGSTVEFDFHTTDGACTADIADLRSACLVARDGKSCSDSESRHKQLKRAAVLSVLGGREQEGVSISKNVTMWDFFVGCTGGRSSSLTLS